MLRRHLLLGLFAFAGAGVCTIVLSTDASAQGGNSAAELLKAGLLPEKSFGDPSAPVTVIEYASLTCHHCQNFHKNTWPAFKVKYVDSGKVRFIMREFPLDALAVAGSMLARCSGDAKWYPVVDLLYTSGESWNHADDAVEALARVMRQTGMTREGFDACLKDEKLYQDVLETRKRGVGFGVDSTPTFFINGRKETGALTLQQMDQIIEPLLSARPQ